MCIEAEGQEEGKQAAKGKGYSVIGEGYEHGIIDSGFLRGKKPVTL